MINELLPLADKVAIRLIAQKQTLAVAESSAGGLISAALLAVPGASAYFLGSAVVYTRVARRVLMDIPDAEMKVEGVRSSSEPYAELLAKQIRSRLGADWALSETGAAGPSGNRYGDPAGHTCIAVAGPNQAVMTLETESADRADNMRVFAATALTFLLHTMSS